MDDRPDVFPFAPVDLAAGLTVAVLYVTGALPTIYWADSGELVAGSYQLGLAHAPSFPVYALCLKGFSLLPVGDMAFRASVWSGLCGVLAAMALCAATRTLLGRVQESPGIASPVAWAVTVLYAIGPQTWEVSVRQEVYTFHLCLAFLTLWLILQWRREYRLGPLLASGCVFGLALGNHSLLTLCLFPPILCLLLLEKPSQIGLHRVLGWTFAAFGLGLSCYLYLPIRSTTFPFLDWNHPAYVSGFIESFTKKGEAGLFIGDSGYVRNGVMYLTALVDGFTPWLIWLAPLGVVPLFRRDWKIGLGILLLAGANAVSVIIIPRYDWENPDIPGYLLLSFAVCAVWIGVAVFRMMVWATQAWRPTPSRCLAWTVALLLVAVGWQFSSPRVPHTYDPRARLFGLLHLQSAPAGSLMLTRSDAVTFLNWYLQSVEGRRPDVTVINRKGLSDRSYIWTLGVRFPGFLGEGKTPESELHDRASDRITRTTRAVERVLQAQVPRRPVLWESGSDNSWVLDRSLPRGPMFELVDHPTFLTPYLHRNNLGFQRHFLRQMAAPAGYPDPRAGKALEVVIYNLCSALYRDRAAGPVQIAEALSDLWQVRPGSVPVGVRLGAARLASGDAAGAFEVFHRLMELEPETVDFLRFAAKARTLQGRPDLALDLVLAGLQKHLNDAPLLEMKQSLEATGLKHSSPNIP